MTAKAGKAIRGRGLVDAVTRRRDCTRRGKRGLAA